MRSLPHYVIALACLAGAVLVIQASGIGTHLGIAPETGIEDGFIQLGEDLDEVTSDQRGVDSLIGLAISSIDLLYDMMLFIVLFPVVLSNLGIPMWVALPLSVPVWTLATFFVMAMLRGAGFV